MADAASTIAVFGIEAERTTGALLLRLVTLLENLRKSDHPSIAELSLSIANEQGSRVTKEALIG